MRTSSRVITMIFLIVAVIGISVGFAAFSNTLTIKSTADLDPNQSNFRLVFANNNNVNNLDTTSPVAPLNQSTLGSSATIINGTNPRLRGITANFTSPGQSVSYRVYIVNTGKYTSYLTNLVFGVSSGSSYNTCTPIGNTNASSVATACSDIYVTVQIGNQTFRSDGPSLENEISNLSVEPNQSHEMTVTVTYTDSGNYPNGDFRVRLGDIMLQYRTVNSPTQSITPPSQGPTDSSCFVSVIPGQINGYLCDSTDLVIADNLQLGTRSVETISFNNQKCLAFENILTGIDSNYTCTNLEYQFNSLKDSQQGLQQIYNTFLEALAIATYGDEGSTKYSITTIQEGAFTGGNLTSLVIGEGVTTIGMGAFATNSIVDVELPSTLTTIGPYSLGQNRIQEIDLKNVQTIGDSGFDTNQLQYVYIPNSVTSIGRWAFGSNNLQSVSLGSGLTSTGVGAFELNQITSIDFSRATNLEAIDDYAFQNNNLISITIPSSVENIGADAFRRNELTSVDFSRSTNLTHIGDYAFKSNNLTSVSIPNSVTEIGEWAFDENNITTITIGNGLTTIESGAFGYGTYYNNNKTYGPNAIRSITINALKANVSGINSNTFGYDPNANCENTIAYDDKSNSCITWVNG